MATHMLASQKSSFKRLASKELGTVTRSLIAGGAMDVFQGDAFIRAAGRGDRPGEVTVQTYQKLTRSVRDAIDAGEPGLASRNATRAVASTMLAVQGQALALDVANQQINLLRLEMLDADEDDVSQLQEDIVQWQAHAETLRDGLDASRDQLDRLQEKTGITI